MIKFNILQKFHLIRSYERFWWKTIGRSAPFMDPCEEPHPFVIINNIQIDQKIADIITSLWKQNIETYNSCQGEPSIEKLTHHTNIDSFSRATITFGTTDDARWFAACLRHVMGAPIHGKREIEISYEPNTDYEYHHVYFSSLLLNDKVFIHELCSTINVL